MASCSDDFPTTDVLYDEISGDTSYIVLLAIGCVLALITILLYIEIVFYMKRVGYTKYLPHYEQRCLLLGLYPVICVMSVISLIVPTSTTIIDLIISCYISWCIHTFVQMTLDYFGGESGMIQTLSKDKVRMSTPPCCCCCCCLLKPITLTKKSLRILRAITMQVAFIQPVVLFVAAVLWTDGKYEQEMKTDSSYLYIGIISGISTILSMYGLIVIFRASVPHLRENCYTVKFAVLQVTMVITSLQNVIFIALAENDIPGCNGSRGSRVRNAGYNHAILVIESFLIGLLARYGYRRKEPHLDRLPRHESGIVGVITEDMDTPQTHRKPPYYGANTNRISADNI